MAAAAADGGGGGAGAAAQTVMMKQISLVAGMVEDPPERDSPINPILKVSVFNVFF